MSKRELLRQLQQAAQTMVQGGLSRTTRRCGNPACACHRDARKRHGPHLYLTYRQGGKSRALYIPAEHWAEAEKAQGAWERFWEIGCALAALNREEWQRHWERSKRRRP